MCPLYGRYEEKEKTEGNRSRKQQQNSGVALLSINVVSTRQLRLIIGAVFRDHE
jgi:hypothetical protein